MPRRAPVSASKARQRGDTSLRYVKFILGPIATLAIIVGCVWTLQGVNVLPGSFMTGDVRWAYRGTGLALIAAAVLWWALRTPSTRRGIVGGIGALLLLGGTIWILQGLNVLLGSPMSGDIRWSYRGAVLALVGVTVLSLSLLGMRTIPRDE